MAAERRWDRARAALLAWSAAAFAAGAALRLYHFAFVRRCLWMDEAMMAVNIPARSFAGLLRPLDYNATAPFPFLWLERACVVAWTANELALRAVPLLGGLAVIVVVGRLGGRLYGEPGAYAAVLLAALSPTLLRFSNEVRPYSTDALVTAAIVATTVGVARHPASRARWLALLAITTVGVLASFPAIFVAMAALFSLLLIEDIRRTRALWILGGSVLCALACAAPYLLIYRTAAGGPELQGAWNAAFLTLGPGLGTRIQLAVPGLLLPTFLGNGSAPPAHDRITLLLVASLLTLGAFEAARRHGAWVLALLVGPIALTAVASALRRYPFGVPRHTAFAAPLLVLMMAGAAAWVHARVHERVPARIATPVLTLALVAAAVPMARDDLAGVREPFVGEDARTLVGTYLESDASREPIYVSAKAIPAWVFYTTNWARPRADRLDFYAAAATHGLAWENRPSRGRPVAGEGADLVYDNHGRREILGIATGREWRWPAYTQAGPDEGWAANEAERIRQEALREGGSPCAWLLFTRLSERSLKPLQWTLRDDLHARLERETHVPGGALLRYCFPR